MTLGSIALREHASFWYGDVPNDWTVARFKHLATVRNGQVDPEAGQYKDLPLFAPNHIESGTGRLLGIESADEQGAESGKYLVEAGELVYSKIRPALRKVIVAPFKGLCSADMYPVQPTSHVAGRFLFYSMLSEGFSQYALLKADRVAMPKINRETLAECIFVYPDREQQIQIAAFLDRKTAAIDALIAKKERLIELLQEKQQALIVRAVTKGLHPNVPMKDSGIVWMGQIPAHWQFGELRRRWRIVDCKHRTPNYVDDGFALVSTTEVKPGRLDLGVVTRRVGRDDYVEMTSGGRMPRRGDIIYSRNASLGAAAYVDTDQPFCMGQDVVLITSSAQDQLYLSYVLNSRVGIAQVDLACIGSTFKRINVSQIAELVVPFPPPDEQRIIAQWVDVQVARLASLVGRIEAHIDKLCEYRQALITAAVTGKLDVRECPDYALPTDPAVLEA